MPVYGQATSFNDRLVSLLSSVVCNTNDLYNGHRPIAIPPSAVSSNTTVRRRPLFREAILRKATNLRELTPASWATPTATTAILEIVLIVDNGNQETEAACDKIANFISRLLIPYNSKSRIEITRVHAHTIREELCGNSASGAIMGARRQRLFVALGSAIMGLHHYLLMTKSEIGGTSSTSSGNINNNSERQSEYYLVLGAICVDPPPHLWKAYGNPLLDHLDAMQIPSLVAGYDDANDAIHSLRHILKETTLRPRTLIVVARQAARMWTTGEHLDSNKKNQDRNEHVKLDDACFWIARLITKYAEAVQRIRTPPGAVISSSRVFGEETNSIEDALSMRSKL